MAIFETKVTSKGQLTVPVEIRDLFHIKPGDRILFCARQDGRLEVVVKNRDLDSLVGMLDVPPNGKTATVEEIDEAIGQAFKTDDRRLWNDWDRHERPSEAAGERRPAAE